MHSPRISIICPVYNAEKYLRKCVDSVLVQTFTDFELLLVDDGSHDGSGVICDEYAEKDSRVRVFHKENGGVSSARNIGLKYANGEWVYFIDSDDELYINTLDILTKNIDESIAYVMAGYTQYNELGEIKYSIKTRRIEFIRSIDAISQMFKPKDYIYHGYLWNKLFRLSIIKRCKYRFDEKIHFNEDRLFNVLYLIMIRDGKCLYMTAPVYKYIEREGSAMDSLKKSYNSMFVTDLDAYINMLNALKSVCDYKNIKLCKNQLYLSYVYNISLMKKYSSYTNELDNVLYNKLRQQLSLIDITYFRIKSIVGLLKSKLLK